MKYLKSDIEKTYYNRIIVNQGEIQTELYFDTTRKFNVFISKLNKADNDKLINELVLSQTKISPHIRYLNHSFVFMGFKMHKPKLTSESNNELLVELKDLDITVTFELHSIASLIKLEHIIQLNDTINFQICTLDFSDYNDIFGYNDFENYIYALIDSSLIKYPIIYTDSKFKIIKGVPWN